MSLITRNKPLRKILNKIIRAPPKYRALRYKSKAFERSIKSAANTFPFSAAFFHFSSIASKQCRALKPFLDPYSYCSGVFIVNFEYISHLVLVFLFLALNK